MKSSHPYNDNIQLYSDTVPPHTTNAIWAERPGGPHSTRPGGHRLGPTGLNTL